MPLGPEPPRPPQLDGDSPGTVSATYCSSGSVLTVRAWPAELYSAVNVPRTVGLPPATHNVRCPPMGDAVGVPPWFPKAWDHGPAQPGPVSMFHVPLPLCWNRTAAALGTPGAATPPPAAATMMSSPSFSVMAMRTLAESDGSAFGCEAAAPGVGQNRAADNTSASGTPQVRVTVAALMTWRRRRTR